MHEGLVLKFVSEATGGQGINWPDRHREVVQHHNTEQLTQSNIPRWHVEEVRTLSVNITVQSSRAQHLWRRYPRIAGSSIQKAL